MSLINFLVILIIAHFLYLNHLMKEFLVNYMLIHIPNIINIMLW